MKLLLNSLQKTFMLILTLTLCHHSVAKEGKKIWLKSGDAKGLIDAIDELNKTNADLLSERSYIFLPNGVYDFGDKVLTTISGNNISIIGESMDGVIVKNSPDVANEGISKTATFLIKGTGTYLQSLTIQNAMKFYESKFAGRAVTVQDKGNHTIMKKVRLLSYQDTYYSNCSTSQYYFEDCEIHGNVDFICGEGDVYFNRCTIVSEKRNLNGKGESTIAAPRTNKTDWGFVMYNCVVKTDNTRFNFGRAWKEKAMLAYVNTTIEQPELLVATRFNPNCMGTIEQTFVECGTVDGKGKSIVPASNVVEFSLKGEKRKAETILPSADAKKYAIGNVYKKWRADKICKKLYFEWKNNK